jgi:sec-independent protein translocase protein TatC
LDDPEEYRLTLIEHLTELRDRLVRSLIALIVGFIAGWLLVKPVYDILENTAAEAIRKVLPKGSQFIPAFNNATAPFLLKMRLAFMIDLVLVFPFLIVQIWGFVSPGLKPSERRPFKILAPYSVLLFFMGASFCWMILPAAFQWFATYLQEFPGTSLFQEPGFMTFFALKMLVAFGIGFQLPLIVYGLGMAGLLTGDSLVQNWRQAATGIFVAAMVITPSNDLPSMLMMAIPLVCLFGVSVVAVRMLEKKRGKLNKVDEYPIE